MSDPANEGRRGGAAPGEPGVPYQLPPRPMSRRTALPAAPDVLEGRRLLWRDTSIALVAIALVAVLLLVFGFLGGDPRGSPEPAASGTPDAFASARPVARAARVTVGERLAPCYTPCAPVSE